MKTWIIYKHTNILNGKNYVGQTDQEPDRRWRKNAGSYYSYSNCKAFYRALVKYGWEGFETVILATTDNEPDALKLESKFQLKFNSHTPNGYNIDRVQPTTYQKSEETKKLISEKKLGKKTNKPACNRKNHIIINNIEYKECSRCNKALTLDNYRKDKNSYDGLYGYCKNCCKAYVKERGYKYKRKDPELVKESIKSRNQQIGQVLKKKYEDNPELRNVIRNTRIKAKVKATNLTTGEVRVYDCANDAKKLDKFYDVDKAIKLRGGIVKKDWKFEYIINDT